MAVTQKSWTQGPQSVSRFVCLLNFFTINLLTGPTDQPRVTYSFVCYFEGLLSNLLIYLLVGLLCTLVVEGRPTLDNVSHWMWTHHTPEERKRETSSIDCKNGRHALSVESRDRRCTSQSKPRSWWGKRSWTDFTVSLSDLSSYSGYKVFPRRSVYLTSSEFSRSEEKGEKTIRPGNLVSTTNLQIEGLFRRWVIRGLWVHDSPWPSSVRPKRIR